MRGTFTLAIALLAPLATACSSSDKSALGDGGGDAAAGGAAGSSGGGTSGGGASGGAGTSGGSSSGSGASSSGGSNDSGTTGGPDGGSVGQDGSSSSGVPAFDRIFVIVMENESQTAIQGSSEAPYIQTLLGKYAYTNHYSTTYHPSLPNYLDLTSGSPQGVTCDCQPVGTACDATCSLFTGNCNCHQSATNLGDQLDGASIPWRNYGESMGTPCNGALAAPYAPKHVPFLYYDDVYTNSSRCQQRVRDYGDFAADLAGDTYRYSLVAPNLCDDMHGDPTCPSSPSAIAQGDTWLSHEVPKLLATPGFAAGGKDVLFIVWDEQTGSTGGTSTPMLMIAISPLAKSGATATAYNHESLLATIEDSFGLARLGGAASATPINDIWK